MAQTNNCYLNDTLEGEYPMEKLLLFTIVDDGRIQMEVQLILLTKTNSKQFQWEKRWDLPDYNRNVWFLNIEIKALNLVLSTMHKTVIAKHYYAREEDTVAVK